MPREPREYRLGVRLLPAERQALEALAERRGELVSETVRGLLSEAVRSEERGRRRTTRRSAVRAAVPA
jgi:hypothetical protein